jgi:predicted NBD/HSP70 family sugar kinase
MLDEWGRPAGSSYAGMKMDTQTIPDALRLAGLPDTPIWILNDAELAAASAIFDERVIRCGGKALVFTLGTAVGCAIADPLAAALHFAGAS